MAITRLPAPTFDELIQKLREYANEVSEHDEDLAADIRFTTMQIDTVTTGIREKAWQYDQLCK